MKKEDLIFRIAARCEAAGRPNNEDNYQVDENLADDRWGFTADKEIALGEKGALLVVCDGMGGMNAGEVASAIAVATIKEWFDKEKLTNKILESSASIQSYMVHAIQAADAAIKADGKSNPEHEGMGSTIVMAWLLGKKVYIGWCGDSRAYRFNPTTGLQRLSHDHSYVQELVDAGKLTEELAFDHPNNNIITRSLGDPRGKAQPDTKEYDLCNEDIILLCSDGLCGCLRDNEIENVMKQHQTSMQECRDALWDADEAAGWHDNVTIALAQVISGGAIATKASAAQPISKSKAELIRKNRRLKVILGAIVALVVLACAGFCLYRFLPAHVDDKEKNNVDSTLVEQPTTGVDNAVKNKEDAQQKKAETSKEAEKKVTPKEQKEQVKKDAQPDPIQVKLAEVQPNREEPKVEVITVPKDEESPAKAEVEEKEDKKEAPKAASQEEETTLDNGKQMKVVEQKADTSVTVKITD